MERQRGRGDLRGLRRLDGGLGLDVALGFVDVGGGNDRNGFSRVLGFVRGFGLLLLVHQQGFVNR